MQKISETKSCFCETNKMDKPLTTVIKNKHTNKQKKEPKTIEWDMKKGTLQHIPWKHQEPREITINKYTSIKCGWTGWILRNVQYLKTEI